MERKLTVHQTWSTTGPGASEPRTCGVCAGNDMSAGTLERSNDACEAASNCTLRAEN